MKSKLQRRLRFSIIILLILAFIGIIYFLTEKLLPGLIPILEHGDEAEIEDYIRGFGSFKGALFTAILQFLQVISIVLPGTPIQIAAGIIFGILEGYLICHLSFILSNTAVFLAAKRLGVRLGTGNEKKESKLKFLIDPVHPEFTVFFGCMLPLLPNGIVPYIAARTSITVKRFIISVALGSFPTIFLLCAIGGKILEGEYFFVAILLFIVILLMVLTHIFKDKLIKLLYLIKSKLKK